jgi:cell division protein FtsW
MATELVTTQSRWRRRGRLDGQAHPGTDIWLLAVVIVLSSLGLLIIYSATFALSYYNFEGRTDWYLMRQLTWLGIGVVALLICWRLDYRHWQKWSTPLMGLTVLVLVAMFVIGKASFGAVRWLLDGGSVQPAEAAKLTTIIYVAHWASSKGERIRSVEVGLVPFGILIGLVCGLILMQPSFSTALLVGVVATTMFFIAGADLKQLAITGAAAAAGLFFIARSAAYRAERIAVFQDPWAYAQEGGYQTTQVLYALARGGLFGEGLGTSKGNVPALPAGHTDAIFAIMGQEMGLGMGILVLGLFLFLAHRGFRIAAKAPDAFGTVLASGVTCWVIYQALFNVAVVTNSIPPTGIPMPFISFGGSGLVSILAAMGILMSISRAEPRAEKVEES